MLFQKRLPNQDRFVLVTLDDVRILVISPLVLSIHDCVMEYEYYAIKLYNRIFTGSVSDSKLYLVT